MASGIVYRVFKVQHNSLTIMHIGDFNKRDDAMMALHLDKSDEPAPDKDLFYSWHLTTVYHGIAIDPK